MGKKKSKPSVSGYVTVKSLKPNTGDVKLIRKHTEQILILLNECLRRPNDCYIQAF